MVRKRRARDSNSDMMTGLTAKSVTEETCASFPEVTDHDPVGTMLRVFKTAVTEREDKADAETVIQRSLHDGERQINEEKVTNVASKAISSRGAVKMDPRLRSAELAAASYALLRQVHARPTLSDARVFVGEISQRLTAAQRAELMKSFALIIGEGEQLSFVAVECLRWLCLDTELRYIMLFHSDCVAALMGAALTAWSQVEQASNENNNNNDDANGNYSERPWKVPSEIALVRGTLDLFALLFQFDPKHTRAKLVQTRALKLLIRIRDSSNKRLWADFGVEVQRSVLLLIEQTSCTLQGQRLLNRLEKKSLCVKI